MQPLAVGAAALAVLPNTRISGLAFRLAGRAVDHNVVNLHVHTVCVIGILDVAAAGT